jgi:RNA polymerase sigma-70 factor (ECF subfamily)
LFFYGFLPHPAVMNNSSNFSQAAGETTALLAAVAARGDKDAFAKLFAFYAPRLKTYLTRMGAGDAVAEELVQETFLTVWRKAGLFDPARASAGTWIFTIARNLRIDSLRRARRPEIDLSDPVLVPDPEPPPDHELEVAQTHALVQDAFAQLPEDQATVIRLAFLEDKSHSQIAAQLALPLGTVKSRLRLALRRMRIVIEDE